MTNGRRSRFVATVPAAQLALKYPHGNVVRQKTSLWAEPSWVQIHSAVAGSCPSPPVGMPHGLSPRVPRVAAAGQALSSNATSCQSSGG